MMCTDRLVKKGAGPFLSQVRAGFTLIELLVVVAVIAVLMAILLPSLGAARERSRSVSCLSNLRQMALATNMYLDMNNNTFPYCNRGTMQWWLLLQNVVSKNEQYDATTAVALSKMFICPSTQLWPGDATQFSKIRDYGPHQVIFNNTATKPYKRQYLAERGNEVVMLADMGQSPTNPSRSSNYNFGGMSSSVSTRLVPGDPINNNRTTITRDEDTDLGNSSFRWRHRGLGDRNVVNVAFGDFSVGSFWYIAPLAAKQQDLLVRNLRYDGPWSDPN